jgi:hypothetical protein
MLTSGQAAKPCDLRSIELNEQETAKKQHAADASEALTENLRRPALHERHSQQTL